MRFSHFFAKAPANLCSHVAFLEELNCIDIQKLAKSNRPLGGEPFHSGPKRGSPGIPPLQTSKNSVGYHRRTGWFDGETFFLMRRWAVTGMLCLLMVVNFADKAAFGLAAEPIMGEMHLSYTQFGALGASFFALFSAAALIVGWLGDRVPTKWLLAGMALVWTAAQLPFIASVSLATFFGCRIVLGAGEGPALPTALHAAYKWFPDRQRPLVTGLIEAGLPLGAACAALAVTWTIVRAGWHVAFGALGAVSLLWCGVWLLVASEPPLLETARSERVTGMPVSLRHLLLNRTMIGATVAAFAAYWVSALAVVWLPSFLEVAAGLTPAAAGNVLSVAWLLQVPLFPAVGLASGSLSARGYDTDFARGAFATLGVALSGGAMIALSSTKQDWLLIAVATLCLSSTVIVVTIVPAIVAEIAPAWQRSTALGACVAVSALGGIVAPLVFGRVVDITGRVAAGYRVAFLLSGSTVVVAAAVAQLLMRPREDGERLHRLSVPSMTT
jgi:ACS family D-galactonate transporter-like MFS transporter